VCNRQPPSPLPTQGPVSARRSHDSVTLRFRFAGLFLVDLISL
jgi:hypothetical protein